MPRTLPTAPRPGATLTTPLRPAALAALIVLPIVADRAIDRALARLPKEQRHLEAALLARNVVRHQSARLAVQAAELALRAACEDFEASDGATPASSTAHLDLLYVLDELLSASGFVRGEGVWLIDPTRPHEGPLAWDVDGLVDVAERAPVGQERRVAA